MNLLLNKEIEYQDTVLIADDEPYLPIRLKMIINLYAFLMAFPVIIIFQNLSVYVFIILLFSLSANKMLFLYFSTPLQKIALWFGLGAILSTISAYFFGGSESFSRSMAVMPNYLYWAFLIIFLITYRDYLDLKGIFKAITIGIFCSILFFFFIQKVGIIREFGIFKRLTQNGFAFILICYTPIVVYYIKITAPKVVTIIAIVILSIIGFISGSRSSSILVMAGALLSYFLTDELQIRRALFIIVLFSFALVYLSTSSAEKLIKSLNPRTYSLIYATEDTFSADRSYLLRRAMIDKGIDLFTNHPFTGIGLNNFSKTYGKIKGEFAGSEFVINKNINTGSDAHNSYVNVLAEGGLFLAIPMFLIILKLIVHLFLRFKSLPSYKRVILIGVLMMAIHLYFITAIVNVFAWFLIGLASAMIYRNDTKRDIA